MAEIDGGVVITGSRQVVRVWSRLSARILCEGTRESAHGDVAELRHALNDAIATILALSDVAETAGVKPAPPWE